MNEPRPTSPTTLSPLLQAGELPTGQPEVDRVSSIEEEEPASPRMGQNASSNTSQQLERLQEQLKASVQRAEQQSIRSSSTIIDSLEDGDEDTLFIPSRRRSTSHSNNRRNSPSSNSKGKGKARPASAFIPASGTWANQLSELAFPSRKSLETLRSTDSPPPSVPSSSASTASTSSSTVFATPVATPPRRASLPGRGTSPSPKFTRRSPKPSPTPSFRHSLRLPFLPSIPASPLPPILSPTLTRSASSPPILPAIPSTASLSPTLHFTPPTAGLAPQPQDWPSETMSYDFGSTDSCPPPPFPRSLTSASAPNLTLLASAPIDSSASSNPLYSAHEPPPLSLSTEPSPPTLLEESLTFDPELLITDTPSSSNSPVEDRAPIHRSQREEKRYHALVELVETETGYLEHLRALVKVYFQTLPFLTLLSTSEVEAVVRNAESLLELHERISYRLEQVEEELKWREGEGVPIAGENETSKVHRAAQRIAQVFADELPNFHLYNDFCARHAEAMDITRRLSTRPEWEAYERQCALRVASQGDITPLASRSNSQTTSPFFPTIALPPISTSLPSSTHGHSVSPSPTTSPAQSVLALPISSSVPASSSTAASRSRAKLRFSDFAIAPVQRIMRYPLVFGSLAKYCEGEVDEGEPDRVKEAFAGLKTVAEGVDAAKREREGEIRTRIVASRMEFQSTVSIAFCDILGPTILVGALHVLHRSSMVETLRVKYYGCFLYRSHLILAKIKKRASYEPREWLPLRLFEITSLEEGQGLLSQSIRLKYNSHVLELGALCASEKSIWLNRLLKAQTEARQVWDDQPLDDQGKHTLFDDTLISSVSPIVSTNSSTTPRKGHQRSASSVSVTSVLAAAAATPASSNSPFIAQDEPLPTLPADSPFLTSAPPLTPISSNPTPTLSNRSRFSTTASSLLGRTPSAQRAAVDLRLADVSSEECLAARAQAAREVAEQDDAGRRIRTMSGPKRSMTAGFPGSTVSSSSSSMTGKMLTVKDRRRMSSFELEMGRAGSVADFRSTVGYDPSVFREEGLTSTTNAPATTPERKWASAIRKTKSAGSRARPALPEIDTALAEAMNKKHRSTGEKQAPLTASATGSLRSKADNLRRVASHSSLDGPGRLSTMSAYVANQTPSASPAVKAESAAAALAAGAADVERNNSVSSTTSSNGTGTNSSSSHSHSHGSHGLHLIETPPSSIPPSPDFCALELVEPFPPAGGSAALKPSLSTRSTAPRWSSHALSDGVSNVFRIKRRKSALGLAPAVSSFAPIDGEEVVASGPPVPPPHTRNSTSTSITSTSSSLQASDSSSNTAGAKLARRSSTLGGYFQKRVQSSPTLTGFFASALGSTSSPHLPLTSAPPSMMALHSPTPSHENGGSGSSSPSETSLTYHTPTSVPATPETPQTELPATTNSLLPTSSRPTVTATPTAPAITTPRSKKNQLASKVGRTVSSTFGNMGRQRSSEGSTSSSGSTSGSALTSRKFHFNRLNGMSPLT